MSTDSWGQYLSDLLPALLVSVELTAGALLLGFPLGIILAVGLLQQRLVLRLPALAVVEAGRGFPVLVILYLLYFGLPQIDITLTAKTAAIVGLAISFGAYTSDVFRAGLLAVPVGQTEAGLALGLSRSTLFMRVQLPQAVKIVIPPLLGWSIVYFQASSLAYALAVPELMSRAYVLATANFQYLYMIGLAAVLYGAISIPLSLISERMSVRTARAATNTKQLNPALTQ